MTRQEKGTRLRGLPPREQLKILDNASGSAPTVVRFSTDGRPGKTSSSFDDTRAISFGRNVDYYYPGIGIASGSRHLNTSGASDFPLTTTIIATGSNRAGLIDDSFFIETKPEQRLAPFKEHKLFESDAKSQLTQSAFWATGSAITAVGEGFTSPLWSKQKIEIDINVSSSTTLNLRVGTAGLSPNANVSFPMAYYNFSLKTWEPIGLGYDLNSWVSPLPNALRHAADNLMIGFVNGLLPPGNSHPKLNSCGTATSHFGFPYHPKFHATSSQVLKMSSYIDRPFVLEKAVIEISGTWQLGSIVTGLYNISSRRTVTSSINTCFLLNQRRNQNFSFEKLLGSGGEAGDTARIRITASLPVRQNLDPNSTTPTYIDTIRDLVGFSQVYSFASGAFTKLAYDSSTEISSSPGVEMPITVNEIVLTNNSTGGSSGADWTGKAIFSMSMCTPTAGTYHDVIFGGGTDNSLSGAMNTVMLVYDSSPSSGELFLGHEGTRTGLGLFCPSTRGLANDYYNSPTKRNVSFPTYDNGLRAQIEVTTAKHKINPYILLPSDELILGWQIPIAGNPVQGTTADQNESTFTFHTGSYKMTLYGSYVSEGREHNETLNQLLSSKTIHETIG